MEDAYVHWPYRSPPKYEPFFFENFDVTKSRQWFWKNWTLTLYISVAYVVLIYFGQRYMRNRSAFGLRPALAMWNLILALFSAFGFFRVFPELIDVIRGPDGFYRSVCVRYEVHILITELQLCISVIVFHRSPEMS
jgi:elongation of very long chain fatty acids protein 6